MQDLTRDLLGFIDRAPTPYHAVEESARRLEANGFERMPETNLWSLGPGARAFVVRNEGSLIALEIGMASPVEAGFRLIGAHTDSPNLRLKPKPDVEAHGYRQLGVEVYGGVLLHTWLDRDLSLAGRVTLREDGQIRTVLIDFERPLLRIPSLAIHMGREVNKAGLQLDAQQHLVPVLGLESAPPLAELLAEEMSARSLARVAPDGILAFDLMLHDAQPSGVAGARGEFILAPRLDNLGSCHAAVTALTTAAREPVPPFTRGIVLYDHEEIGSRTSAGAAGPFLLEVLERVVQAVKGDETQALSRALASSMLVSADMAHAVHPNFAEKHDPGHHPVVGGGPVIKVSASQSYTGDAVTIGRFAALCAQEGVEPQHFVGRNDIPCGTTIGPITAARIGVRTVDVGNPMLSMHSCREMAGSADVEPMIRVLRAYLNGG
jgi:aspartyl aminopeptidase